MTYLACNDTAQDGTTGRSFIAHLWSKERGVRKVSIEAESMVDALVKAKAIASDYEQSIPSDEHLLKLLEYRNGECLGGIECHYPGRSLAAQKKSSQLLQELLADLKGCDKEQRKRLAWKINGVIGNAHSQNKGDSAAMLLAVFREKFIRPQFDVVTTDPRFDQYLIARSAELGISRGASLSQSPADKAIPFKRGQNWERF